MGRGGVWAGLHGNPTRRVLLALTLAIALVAGMALTALDTKTVIVATGAVAIVTILALREDVAMAIIIAASSIFFDWYHVVDSDFSLHFPVVATSFAALLLGITLLSHSSARPWISVPNLGLWALLIMLTLPPITQGVYLWESIMFYEVGVIVTPLLAYMVGTQIARSVWNVRLFLALLCGFATVIAAHTTVVAFTGTFLLATQRETDYLATKADFTLAQSGASRSGSFLLNPDWNGVFLATMTLVAAGLLVQATSRLGRIVYASEVALLLAGLLFTYSLASWFALCCGAVALLVLAGRGIYRAGLAAALCTAGALVYVAFPSQVQILLQRTSTPEDATLRLGAWETAARVIAANPLFGIGWGQYTYLARAEPYRVPAQSVSLSHPHNSYLEFGAMAGLPVLVLYLTLLGATCWRALQNLHQLDTRSRPLLAGALAAAVAFSVNSFAINAWTLPPLAALAWLILGVAASPALALTGRPAEPETVAVRTMAIEQAGSTHQITRDWT